VARRRSLALGLLGLLGSLSPAACHLDLTGAACSSNSNCPLHQHCQLPLGEKTGVCQPGGGVFAGLAIDAEQRLLPVGGATQAFATLSTDGGPAAPDGGLVTELVDWFVPVESAGLISVSGDAGSRGQVVALAPGQATLGATMVFAGQKLEAFNTIVVSNAELQRIVAVPDRLQYAVGTAGSVAATGFFSDGTHAELTSLVKWSSSAPGVVSVSNASGSWGRLSASSPGRAGLLASYLALDGGTSVTVSSATLLSLSISPLHPRGAEGSDLQLEATGVFSDGSAQPMTRTVHWSSDDPGVADFVSGAPGSVSLRAPGSAIVRADATATSAQAALDVVPFAPVQLEIAPAWPDPLLVQSTTQLAAWSTQPDGTIAQAPVSWSTSSPALTLSPLGDLLAVLPGLSTVLASAGPLDAQILAEATGAAPVGWQIWPPELVVPLGAEGFLAVERAHDDGTVQDLTVAAGWRPALSDGGVVDVETGENGGTIRPRQAGARVQVVAVLPGRTARAWVRSPAGTPTLELVPPEVSFPASARVHLAAVGHWPDGTVVDLTASTSWRTPASGWVIAGNGPTAGLVQGVDAGTTTLVASFGGASAQGALSAEPDAGTLEVWPPSPLLAAGTALPLSVTLLSSSGDSTDVSADALWTSSAPQVAIATNAPGQAGQLLGRDSGVAQVTAHLDGLQATVPVVVSGSALAQLSVEGPAAVVTWAPSVFRAVGRFSDGSAQDLTRWVSWTASDPGLLRLRGTGSDRGEARAVDGGVVEVAARPRPANGVTALPLAVTVTTSPLVGITVVGPGGPVAAGSRPAVHAVARAQDGTQLDVTGLVEWTSSEASVARVSSLVRAGWVSALGPGTTTLAAHLDGVTGSAVLQVTSDRISGLSITAPPTLTVGSGATATATAALSGGGTQGLGEDVVWSSDAPGVLAVSNAPGGRGRLVGVAPGTTTLRARTRPGLQNGAQASTVVTVGAAGLRSASPALHRAPRSAVPVNGWTPPR